MNDETGSVKADRLRILLVGLGGYGEVYLAALLDDPMGTCCEIAGAVDPRPENCSRLAELEGLGVPVFSRLDEFYRDHSTDLTVISSPISLHTPHVCQALSAGSHVLVEKPAAAVTEDVDRMIDARNDAKRFVAVGFQWCFSDSILRLKKDILSGRFGAPTGGRTLTLWPRAESYYQRNDWAGKRRDSAGRWILDSPANNAMAHHIHNLLFLLGPTLDRSAEPALLRAFLGRANEIETFDTVAAGIRTASGAELLFLASHAIDVSEAVDPRFRLDFEEGSVEFTGGMAPIRGRLPGGEIVEYPSPDATSQVAKLWFCSRAVREKSAIPCGLETARPHTTFVEALERSAPAPFAFPREVLRETDTAADRFRWVEGLAAAFRQSYATGEWPEPPGGHP